ncbi:MAG TPA: hypothetical protein VEH76_03365 [Methylocystis sp.]|nr:hypothetical protein [Methylocystis sp.]
MIASSATTSSARAPFGRRAAEAPSARPSSEGELPRVRLRAAGAEIALYYQADYGLWGNLLATAGKRQRRYTGQNLPSAAAPPSRRERHDAARRLQS